MDIPALIKILEILGKHIIDLENETAYYKMLAEPHHTDLTKVLGLVPDPIKPNESEAVND